MVTRVVAFASALVALAAAVPAAAAVEVRRIDLGAYPTVRVTALTAGPEARPVLRENGARVAGMTADNLGRGTSVVLLVDRSRSMSGERLADAIAAARTFVASKPVDERVSVIAFGRRAARLSDLSAAAASAQAALRSMRTDAVEGTALYDAVELAAHTVASDPVGARIAILITDGRDVGSLAGRASASAAARAVGMAVYTIGVEGASSRSLGALSRATGGAAYLAPSTTALPQIYGTIRAELRRTWRIEYATAVRPGRTMAISVTARGGEAAHAAARAPSAGPAVPVPAPREADRSGAGAWLVSLGAGLLLLLAAHAFASWSRARRLRARVAPGGDRARRPERRAPRDRLVASSSVRWLERMIARMRFGRVLQTALDRAELPLRSSELALLSAAAGVVGCLLFAAAGVPVVLGVAALGGPYLYVAARGRRRAREFEQQLPDVLLTLAGALKAGHSLRQAIQTVVDESQGPAARQLQLVVAEARLGRPLEEGLAAMAERVRSPNFEFAVNAVLIQREIGGSLATLFETVADTVRQREQFGRKVSALTAQGRMSAYVLIGLPIGLAGVLTLMNPEYMAPLYETPLGRTLIIGSLTMMAIGSLVLRRIVAFKT